MTREKRALVLVLALGDALALTAAQGPLPLAGHGVAAGTAAAFAWAAVTVVLTQVLFLLNGLYEPRNLLAGHREYAGLVRACTHAVIILVFAELILGLGLSQGGIALAALLSLLVAGSWRFLARRLAFALRSRGLFIERLLIVGADEHGAAIARQLHAPRAHGLQVVGFLDDYRPVGASVLDGLRVLGDPRLALETARRCGASTILVVPHAISWESNRLLLELASRDNGVRFQLAPGLDHVMGATAHPTDRGFVPLINLEQLRIGGLDGALKTALDYCVSLLLLGVLAPLLGVCWLASRVGGGGPMLTHQRVLGHGARSFALLMLSRPSGPQPDRGPTRWAWRLRRSIAGSRWAKAPNVVNVLAGRMSLVGPRAVPEQNGASPHPWLRDLLLVRPGLTGPAAEPQRREDVEAQAVKDVAYVRHYSLWLDLRLLFASARRMLRGERGLPPTYQVAPGETAALAGSTTPESSPSSVMEART